ncbi:MAG: hypothetical protein KDE54_31990, partial [Caldilineaceae bacterium]|nr:hypothetical protein [Caldilineaceae bacterium]
MTETTNSTTSTGEDRLSVATQRQLMWWRFKKHKIAVISLWIVIIFYIVVLGAEFLSTSDPTKGRSARAVVPPQPIFTFDHGAFRLHVCGIKGERDSYTLQKTYKTDCTQKIDLIFFAHGFAY